MVYGWYLPPLIQCDQNIDAVATISADGWSVLYFVRFEVPSIMRATNCYQPDGSISENGNKNYSSFQKKLLIYLNKCNRIHRDPFEWTFCQNEWFHADDKFKLPSFRGSQNIGNFLRLIPIWINMWQSHLFTLGMNKFQVWHRLIQDLFFHSGTCLHKFYIYFLIIQLFF